ncbi:MAG TPA: DUF1668 domain-containing protein [Thermoleophilaceae bacterium]
MSLRPRRVLLAAGAAAVAAALALAAPPAGAQLGPGWVRLHSSPIARQESKGVRIGGFIYTYGGFENGWYPSPQVERYDIAADSWTVRASAPVGLSHMGVVAHDGKIYVVDGYIGNIDTFYRATGVTVALLMEYDPARDTWRTLTPPPTNRGAVVAGVIGDELYVAGGFTRPQEDLSLLEIYNFKTARWRRGRDMAVARDHAAAAVVDGKLYVIGGRPLSLYGDLGDTERYDPASDRWERLPALPFPRSSMSAVTVGDQIVAIGGENGQRVNGRVDLFDVGTKAWSRLPDMATPREAFAAASYGQRVFAMEGTPTAHLGFTNVAEALDVPAPVVPPALGRLRLKVTPKRVTRGTLARFRFRVTGMTGGALRPVAGARVRFAGIRLRTDRRGRATLRRRIRRPRRQPANATARGFEPARTTVLVAGPR